MAQVTIYMDYQLEQKIKNRAKQTSTSISKLISSILQKSLDDSWSSQTKELCGTWDDIQPLENTTTKDIKRDPF